MTPRSRAKWVVVAFVVAVATVAALGANRVVDDRPDPSAAAAAAESCADYRLAVSRETPRGERLEHLRAALDHAREAAEVDPAFDRLRRSLAQLLDEPVGAENTERTAESLMLIASYCS